MATRHWTVIPASSEPPSEHWAWYQRYTDSELATLLIECGFEADSIGFGSNLDDSLDPPLLQFASASRPLGYRSRQNSLSAAI